MVGMDAMESDDIFLREESSENTARSLMCDYWVPRPPAAPRW